MARRRGIIRIRDLKKRGIHPEYARRMCAKGLLIRQIRGVYSLPDADFTERHTLVVACSVLPRAVVCLLSALRFHDIGTQSPPKVWLALDRGAAGSKRDDLPLQIVRFSGRAFTEGVETHMVAGVRVLVYSPAKTVADCFKYRNKIGLDVALEALKESWRAHRVTMDDLWHSAAICRVQKVMRPYLEALVG